MNIHAPQSLEVKAELMELCSVHNNIITPQSNRPVMGIIQDALTSSYLMTSPECKVSKPDFMQYAYAAGKEDLIPSKILQASQYYEDPWNGRVLFSLLFPNDFHYQKKSGADPNQPVVKIENGILIEGTLCKKTLGATHNSVIQYLNKYYTPMIAHDFISDCHLLANAWMLEHSFSVGLQDCISLSSDDADKKIATLELEAEALSRSGGDPTMIEMQINSALNSATNVGQDIASRGLSENNRLKQMVSSGAKGNIINIAQITGLLGQQNTEGKRVEKYFSHNSRTLPHFNPNDDSPTARGFITSSYLQGLNPHEFFFHMMAGREGIIDTACKTAKTGYIQRRLVKAMEDFKVCTDGTVRNAANTVISFAYGDENMDGAQLIKNSEVPIFSHIEHLVDNLNMEHERDKGKGKIPDDIYRQWEEVGRRWKTEICTKTPEKYNKLQNVRKKGRKVK